MIEISIWLFFILVGLSVCEIANIIAGFYKAWQRHKRAKGAIPGYKDSTGEFTRK